ncbi:MAG: glutamate racemase [Pseudomonadota bacterium]
MSYPGLTLPSHARAPIGVYDSGVGGVSVLRALRAALPDESFIYVSDSLHAPYGERPHEVIQARAHTVVDFLVRQGVKAVVLACNTVSVAAAASLRAVHAFPIVAMEPAIKPASMSTRSGAILVLATSYTVGSPAVERLCREFGTNVRIVLQACPGLVELVERGALTSPQTDSLLRAYLQPGIDAGADTIVLGCTHYAFLSERIARLSGPGLSIIEPSDAVARQLRSRLADMGASAPRAPTSAVFYTSGSVELLQAFLARVNEDDASVHPLPDEIR